MKSDLYKVPPPKIRNIPIYKLEREKKSRLIQNGNRKRISSENVAREFCLHVRAHDARGSARDIVSEPAKRERVNARARERERYGKHNRSPAIQIYDVISLSF